MNAQPKNKRVVFTMSGKGGAGKTGLMVAISEWFEANEIPFDAPRPRNRKQGPGISQTLLQRFSVSAGPKIHTVPV